MDDLIEKLKAAAKGWPGVTVRYHQEWNSEYFEIEQHYFCLIGRNKVGELVMTVKGEPAQNELLREQYEAIVPGYYTNKTHWNSILLEDSTFSEQELSDFLKKSYDLVFAKLPKKIQRAYQKNELKDGI